MNKRQIYAALDNLVEVLASIEHERWSHWQKYMHSKGTKQPDGSILIPADHVTRWTSQMTKPYSELTDEEKDSDREQVWNYLNVIKDVLADIE